MPDPYLTYDFVEEPRRAVAWQASITQPYIRMFGYQVRMTFKGIPGGPMQMVGIDRPTARYGLTWRGTKRARDREHSISGVEMMVYDRQTGEVLSVRRQFIFAPPYKDRPDSNSWLQGEACLRLTFNSPGLEKLSRLPLRTVPPEKPMQGRTTSMP